MQPRLPKNLPVLMRQESAHRTKGRAPLGATDADRTPALPTKERPLIVSPSELRDYLRCRVRWNWRHNEKLQPIGGKPALDIGTLVHQITETWYKLAPAKRYGKTGVSLMQKIAKKAISETTLEAIDDEARELILAMTVGYAAFAQDDDPVIGLGECIPEMEFCFPLSSSGLVYIRGKVDNIFTPTNARKTVAAIETKTKSRVQLDVVELNFQLSTYLWALRQAFPGMRAYRAYYQVLVKKIPTPRTKAELFHREPLERTQEEIDQWAIDTERTALDMLGAAIYPHPTDQCQWDCDFKNACLMRGTPADLQHVLATQFQLKPDRWAQEKKR